MARRSRFPLKEIYLICFSVLVFPVDARGIPGADASSPAPCELKGPPPEIPSIRLRSVIQGLRSPVGLVHAGDGSNRLFIVEQEGSIRVYKEGKLLKDPFLSIGDRVVSGGELGLLGLAFHPDFRDNGRFFINYTSRSGGLHTVISEFRIGDQSDRADFASERILLTFPQPYPNHNGGSMAFGPDGALYIGTGDGGSGNDPKNNGQNLETPLGKILRIDVDRIEPGKSYGIPDHNPFRDRKGVAPEIWAYGLRNPWRFSFDPLTGLLYAGDVGQSSREEIDIIRRGMNYGWRIMEGNLCTPGINKKCNKKGLEAPIWDYPRHVGTVVVGGYVYRGQTIPTLCGVYVFSDFGNGTVFGLRYDGKRVTEHRVMLSTRLSISSLGQDERFELYIVDYAGEVFKIFLSQEPL